MTGSLTGELAHWYIPTYRTDGREKKQCGSNYAIPRGLLLRQGSSSCTALTYCRDGMNQMFCAGTSEGFLTLWSVGGGRCIRSELVLPFAPTQILFWQRYNPLAHGRHRTASPPTRQTTQPSPSPETTPSVSPHSAASSGASASPPVIGSAASSRPRKSSSLNMHNYLLCCGDDNRDVYVVELPSLILLAILSHRSPVLSMSLVPPSYSKLRTPYLVTLTQQHQISMWDLAQIEKKYEEKKRIRIQQHQQQIAQRGRASPTTFSIAITPSSPTSVDTPPPTLPTNFSHPVSSLASNSASIITPVAASTARSASAAAVTSAAAIPHGSIVVRWDEPNQSFTLPLPPFSFTLAPMFVPISMCLSPCGSRAIVVFPYAFLSFDMYTFEVEGAIHSMQDELDRAGLSAENMTPALGQSTKEIGANKYAPWSGAAFISAPANANINTDSNTQYLILWNANGELIWIYSVTTDSANVCDSGAGVAPPSSRSSPSAPRRVVSAGGALEAPELSTHTRSTTRTPRVQMVAKCTMADHQPMETHVDDEKNSPADSPHPPAPAQSHSHSLITVQVSGHTIFAGTDDGSIYQWHIPICSNAHLFDDESSHSRVFTPTHISRISDGFASPATPDHQHAPQPKTPTSHTIMPPQLTRSVTTPALVASPTNATPVRSHSPARVDRPATSTMLIDPWHEAVLLAVGYDSGAIKVYNVLSKASAHLDLSVRHRGMVTCMLNLAGWVDACMLATGGIDGKILIIEMSTGTLHQTLACHAPVMSLHKPTSSVEDSLPPFYRGCNSSLLFANCADSTLRGFSLNDGECVFVGRGLDSPVKVVFRPAWAIAADTLLVQTKIGTVYVFSLSSSHLMQMIELDNGANLFLQRHDLIVPGSQLSILAHRLYQLSHLRRKPLPALPGSSPSPTPSVPSSHNPSPTISRSTSNSNLKKEHAAGTIEGVEEGMPIDDTHFSATPAPSTNGHGPAPLHPKSHHTNNVLPSVSSYESIPALTRTVSSISQAATPLLGLPLNPRSLLKKQRSSGSMLVDSSFQREVYRLNRHHQQLERDEEEHKSHSHGSAASQAHHSALNPPMPTVHHAKPIAHSASVSTIINPNSAVAAPTPAALTQLGTPIRPNPNTSVTPTPYSTGSAASPGVSPPPTARSPIACVDIVTSAGSSASPLQHLHANVYVWNVHQLLPFLATHAAALVSMSKRTSAIAAARADPTNALLAAAANAARATQVPPTFYVLCGLLSTLFDWDSHPPIESILRSDLRCYPPSPPTSFATLTDNSQSLTLLFPNQNRQHQRWAFDQDITARHMLAITTSVTHIMDKAEAGSPAIPCLQAVLTHYQVAIPRNFRLYLECDIDVLATFSLNVNRVVHTSARLLLQQSLDRLSPVDRITLAEQKGRFFEYALPAQRMIFQPEFSLSPSDLVASGSFLNVCENGPGIGHVSDDELINAMLLTWIGIYELRQQARATPTAMQATKIPPLPIAPIATSEGVSEFHAKSQFLTNTLMRMIAWPVATELEFVKCALACSLLAKGLAIFRHHITEPLLLMRRLYALSQHAHEPLATAAHHALLDSGRWAPGHFITCIGKESLNYRNSKTARQGALMCIVGLIKKHPIALARSLPATVRMIVSTLDPAESTMRSTLLQASTSALYALTATYPQVSFHQSTQRFAVGTSTGTQSVIIVYDLRTATKWRILEGHTGDIHAVAFHPKGLSLASYSATENPPSVRVWSTGGGGFLSGLLGMEGKCTQSWPMLPCTRHQPQPLPIPSSQPAVPKSEPEPIEYEFDDVDEPNTDDDDDDPDEHKPMPIRTVQMATNTPTSTLPTRFTVEELITVKIMWISDKTLKLKREDGAMADFSLG